MCGKGRERGTVWGWEAVEHRPEYVSVGGHVVRVRAGSPTLVAHGPSSSSGIRTSLHKNAFSSAEFSPSIQTRGFLPTSFVILFSQVPILPPVDQRVPHVVSDIVFFVHMLLGFHHLTHCLLYCDQYQNISALNLREPNWRVWRSSKCDMRHQNSIIIRNHYPFIFTTSGLHCPINALLRYII